ncbi:MAG: hypothetical protein BWX83_01163 [Candidatus Cloacimonetes bacterium ADurb.Bin117]|nr:MAG: hypothetical protein BWX83_01163 [Candidatus Cloacimonetes bacterium ADurb.Bin117]
MQKRGAFQPDFDEGGAHAWQHVFHESLVDVANDVLLILTFYKEFHQFIILEHGHPLFHGVDVHDYIGIEFTFFHIKVLWVGFGGSLSSVQKGRNRATDGV